MILFHYSEDLQRTQESRLKPLILKELFLSSDGIIISLRAQWIIHIISKNIYDWIR